MAWVRRKRPCSSSSMVPMKPYSLPVWVISASSVVFHHSLESPPPLSSRCCRPPIRLCSARLKLSRVRASDSSVTSRAVPTKCPSTAIPRQESRR